MQLMAKLLFATLMLLGLTMCSSEVPPVQRSSVIDDVELSDIFANPKQFDHVKLRVKGSASFSLQSDVAAAIGGPRDSGTLSGGDLFFPGHRGYYQGQRRLAPNRVLLPA